MTFKCDFTAEMRLRNSEWQYLSEQELLELLLAPGLSLKKAKELSFRLLERLNSRKDLREVRFQDLCRAGLSPRRARAFLAARELFFRVRGKYLFPQHSFRSSLDIFRYFQSRLSQIQRECFFSVLLNGKNRILGIRKISEGSLTSSLVHPREVFRPAIQEGAVGVLFVHNHPSGDP
ncbi:MAG TPA: JAB domain-containing protein, partial [Acidobacteriota bacterium]|nr:JAB domain-containing protein [Acidobacteriota bacterium]